MDFLMNKQKLFLRFLFASVILICLLYYYFNEANIEKEHAQFQATEFQRHYSYSEICAGNNTPKFEMNNGIKTRKITNLCEFQMEMDNRILPPFISSEGWDQNSKSHSFGLNVTNQLNSLNSNINSSYVQIYFDWKMFYPSLQYSIKKYLSYNAQRKKELFTSTTSTVTIDNSTEYKLGQEFVGQIQAKDTLGNNKAFGGDYFFARIVRSNNQNPLPLDAIPCEIKDNLDGTYRLSAPLLLSGSLKLEVMLLGSVEGIAYSIIATSERLYQSRAYKANLLSGETVSCNWDLYEYKGQLDICDYSDPRTKEPWFCTRPVSGKCHPIVTIQPGLGLYESDVKNQLDANFNGYREIFNSGIVFSSKNTNETLKSLTSRGTCGRYTDTYTETTVTGYFKDGNWNSLLCQNNIHDLKVLKQCLSNKIMYFLGDSTMRQFFDYLRVVFDFEYTPPLGDDQHWPPKIAYSAALNTTLFFRAHGLPLINVRSGKYEVKVLHYISDVIGRINGGENVVIVMTVGLHIVTYEPSLFINRFINIRKQIEQLLKSYPGTKIILRGQNLVNWSTSWYLARYNYLMRQIFKDLIRDVIFLDLWGMTITRPIEGYHPQEDTLKHQSFLIGDFICDM